MKKQPDEMEKSIMLKAVLCAWIALEVGLVVFSFVYSTGLQTFDVLSAVPLILAVMSLAVFLIEKRVLTKEMTRPESEDDEE